eukprot:TRINITY_DN1870_c0_g1_i3.p5 TRINITY_DN1870_c0_g1~~TRINITY_DN1870_c0_g1_i3.p5  ORF type:complete len:101 (-),score=11.04 TRINITY_DN1870_c0_g1_i3:1145-1447(-)
MAYLVSCHLSISSTHTTPERGKKLERKAGTGTREEGATSFCVKKEPHTLTPSLGAKVSVSFFFFFFFFFFFSHAGRENSVTVPKISKDIKQKKEEEEEEN